MKKIISLFLLIIVILNFTPFIFAKTCVQNKNTRDKTKIFFLPTAQTPGTGKGYVDVIALLGEEDVLINASFGIINWIQIEGGMSPGLLHGSVKLRLIEEGEIIPCVSIGVKGVLIPAWLLWDGTYSAYFGVISKNFNRTRLHLGVEKSKKLYPFGGFEIQIFPLLEIVGESMVFNREYTKARLIGGTRFSYKRLTIEVGALGWIKKDKILWEHNPLCRVALSF